MPRTRPTRITVTGHVVFDHNFGGCGDIYLYWRQVDAGVEEGSAKQGRAGYFSASIFDGSDWRKLQLSRVVPYAERTFERTAQRSRVADALVGMIRQWRGEWASYNDDSRSFRLPSLEML